VKLLLFIHSLSSGGAERVATNLANYWAKKGWNITIVTLTSHDLDFYPLHPNIQRIALCLGADSASPLDAIKHNYQRIKALRKVLKQQQPDVALGFMTTANILLALAVRRLDISAIGSERVYPPMYPLGKVCEWLRQQTYGNLTAVTAQTHESADWLKDQATAKVIPVIPNAVTYPIAFHSPIITPSLFNKNTFNLLAVGRLAKQKGFDRLLNAFAVLAPHFPDWNLTILGEGDRRQSLEQQREELGLKQRVFLPGNVGNLGDWYEAADLFVMTSLFEGFPNTLVEGMSYGLPVVSVDCDTGPRDIVRHQIDGLLVEQNNHDELVKALASLMLDKALRSQFASRSVEVRERFSMERVAGMWEDLFKEFCK